MCGSDIAQERFAFSRYNLYAVNAGNRFFIACKINCHIATYVAAEAALARNLYKVVVYLFIGFFIGKLNVVSFLNGGIGIFGRARGQILFGCVYRLSVNL